METAPENRNVEKVIVHEVDKVIIQQPAAVPGNGIAVASLVLGIIAILGAWIPIVNYASFVPALLAVIFGAIGMKKAAAAGAPKGMAIAGLVTGIVSLALILIMTIILATAVSSAVHTMNSTM